MEEQAPEERRIGMESIGDIMRRHPALKKMTGDVDGKSREAGPAVPEMTETETECMCRACGQPFTGKVRVYNLSRGPQEIRDSECPACQQRRQAAEEAEAQQKQAAARRQTLELWRRTCGLPETLRGKTFDNFEQTEHYRAYMEALQWVEGFNIEAPTGYPSLIFYSDTPGVGKTHLMVAVANYIFDNWNGIPGRRRSPLVFSKGPGLVRRIRATYNLREQDIHHEREEDVYREVAGVPLLLLDDVGKEAPSKFTRETYWYIIDERVTSSLPVIITSRLPFEGEDSLEELMGRDTVDRLYGMTGGKIVEMTGRSYRRINDIP